MWAFKQLWDKGLIYEGYRVMPYCWRCETPLSNLETAAATTPTATRQDPAVTVGVPLPARPVDGAHALAWTTTPWTLPSNLALAVDPTSSTSSWQTRTASATSSPRPALAALRARAGRGAPTVSARSRVASCVGRALRRRCSPSSPDDARTRTGCSPRDYVTTDDGTGIVHIAPGLRRGRQGRRRRRPASRSVEPVDAHGRFTAEVAAVRGPARLRRQPGRSSAICKGRRACCCATRPTSTPTRTAGAPTAADLQGGAVLVRAGHRVPRPDGRAQPADHLGAGARPGRPVRQVARERARLVHQPQPLLGLARSRCGSATIRTTRASTSTARSTSSSATSACAPTDLHRPVRSTS